MIFVSVPVSVSACFIALIARNKNNSVFSNSFALFFEYLISIELILPVVGKVENVYHHLHFTAMHSTLPPLLIPPTQDKSELAGGPYQRRKPH